MLYMVAKAMLSGVLVMAVSEVAKRSPAFGALIASLPLVSVLGMAWLWQETSDPERLAAHAEATFWYVLPSLPMFLVLPALLRNGIGFWPALLGCCAMTAGLYLGMTRVLSRFGILL